ncbi:unnamed protein product [Heligmosomoides polygyrus]|uniref:Secreted protein n=1 Tax=Heligmosomoides polygyrus TaxID=6339 RepID=A0A183F243_HELPZ|nr:unnamed protein product [Heligmosomoides polygyrus]
MKHTHSGTHPSLSSMIRGVFGQSSTAVAESVAVSPVRAWSIRGRSADDDGDAAAAGGAWYNNASATS